MSGEGIPILWQGADVVAVAKPENIAAIPEVAGDEACLQARLSRQLGVRLWVVHRLDKEVSGVMLFALSPIAHRCLNIQFEERETGKGYHLVTWGCPEPAAGEINRPIRQFGSGRMGVDDATGKPSLTRYTVMKRLPDHALVEARPQTGRRHQLRVHFYSIGHAIAGDPKYGDSSRQKSVARLMLHAAWIEFQDPTGVARRVECPYPESFSRELARLSQAPAG